MLCAYLTDNNPSLYPPPHPMHMHTQMQTQTCNAVRAKALYHRQIQVLLMTQLRL